MFLFEIVFKESLGVMIVIDSVMSDGFYKFIIVKGGKYV